MADNLSVIVDTAQTLSQINPKEFDPSMMQAEDPSILMSNLQQQTDAVKQLKGVVDNLEVQVNRELMDLQRMIDQQNLQMTQQQEAQQTTQQQASNIFNLKTAKAGWTPPLQFDTNQQVNTTKNLIDDPNFTEDENNNVFNFKNANDLKVWLDSQENRVTAEDILMELVPSEQQETITSALEEYYEAGDLTDEDKLELAIKIWPILPDYVKEDKPGIQENIMELPYTEAEYIKQIVKESEETIKKLAQQDSKTKGSFNLKKTAQHKSMENVILYGPEQTYIDEFTRQPASDWSLVERNKGFGLVVDDVWDIDWESVWRGNIMDKYSRPYRDKDGNWVGGYIQKRFEVDKWIPEANNYQLKPGEKRRPYIPEQRSIEARMVAQRASNDCPYEGTEKEKPFNWKEASSKKKNIIADLQPYKSPFDKEHRRSPSEVYLDGKNPPHVKIQYKCPICQSDLKAKTLKPMGVSEVEVPVCPNCKVVGVEVQKSKISPDRPGKQRPDMYVQKGQLVASKKHKKVPKGFTDCGLDDCKSEDFHMMYDENVDKKLKEKQMKDLKSIQDSMNDLAIDG